MTIYATVYYHYYNRGGKPKGRVRSKEKVCAQLEPKMQV